MYTYRKRFNMAALLLALCAALTACGGKQDLRPEEDSPGYASQYLDCDLPLANLTAVCTDGGILYAAGQMPEKDGGEGDVSFSYSASAEGEGGGTFLGGGSRTAIFRVDLAAGTAEELSGYTPAGEGQITVTGLAAAEDGGLWVLEETEQTIPGNPGEMDSGELMTLLSQDPAARRWRKLDAETAGWEMEGIEVTELAEKLGAGAVLGMAVDASNRLYAATDTGLAVLDSGGNLLFTVKDQTLTGQLTRLSDGTVGALTWDGTLRTVDPEAGEWGPSHPLSGALGRVYSGQGERLLCYDSGDSLYTFTADGAQRIFSWSGADVDRSQVRSFTFLPDGRGAALVADETAWPAKYQVALLSPAEGDGEKTVLTLATLGLDSDTRTKILNFNRTNGKYRIQVRDYSEFNTGDDPAAGRTKLNTELIAGNVPDLLDASMDIRQYGARGLLEDLWPYIESDPDIGREGVMERVFQAAETGGKLFQVFPRFTIETAAGAPEIVGEKMGWNLEQLRAALTKLPEGARILEEYETRETVLDTLLSQNLDAFVDWEKGTAAFDSPAFYDILDFCSGFPAGADMMAASTLSAPSSAFSAEARAMSGEQLLLPVYLGDVDSIQLYREILGGGVTFVGYPAESGSGSSFAVEGGLSMTAACADKEGAWSFLRTLLLPGENEAFFGCFPASRPAFERVIRESMKAQYAKDENGGLITGADGQPVLENTAIAVVDGRMIVLGPASQADVDQLTALYEATDRLSGRDEQICSIVRDCAASYFAGDRNAEETAKAIQSRVELYLGERK